MRRGGGRGADRCRRQHRRRRRPRRAPARRRLTPSPPRTSPEREQRSPAQVRPRLVEDLHTGLERPVRELGDGEQRPCDERRPRIERIRLESRRIATYSAAEPATIAAGTVAGWLSTRPAASTAQRDHAVDRRWRGRGCPSSAIAANHAPVPAPTSTEAAPRLRAREAERAFGMPSPPRGPRPGAGRRSRSRPRRRGARNALGSPRAAAARAGARAGPIHLPGNVKPAGDTSTTARSYRRALRSASASTARSSSSGEIATTSACGGSVRAGMTETSFHA